MDPAASSSCQNHAAEADAQRFRANQMGLWVFIATEILFFGGLILCYAVYRMAYPAAFAEGSSHLNFWIGTVNTSVLLTSSFVMTLAARAIKLGWTSALRNCLLITWALGATFIALKGYEYFQKYQEHLIPGINFQGEGQWAPQLQLFVFIYFALTGLHALHMIAGLGLIAWLLWMNHCGRLDPGSHAPVEMTGLYWHFVDCVWVFLYPLLYFIPHYR